MNVSSYSKLVGVVRETKLQCPRSGRNRENGSGHMVQWWCEMSEGVLCMYLKQGGSGSLPQLGRSV